MKKAWISIILSAALIFGSFGSIDAEEFLLSPESEFSAADSFSRDDVSEVPGQSDYSEDSRYPRADNSDGSENISQSADVFPSDPSVNLELPSSSEEELLDSGMSEDLTNEFPDTPGTSGYVFAGYLSDGTPNYVWAGEGPSPDIRNSLRLDSDITFTAFSLDSDDVLTGDLSSVGADANNAGNVLNYLQDPIRRPAYHRHKTMSQETYDYPDGYYATMEGTRMILNGKYFLDGSFAIDGAKYYADENGYIVRGWLKCLYSGADVPVTSLADDNFIYRYYDPVTAEQVTGYQVIDGIPHYFNEDTGYMYRNTGLELSDGYYYADVYGICSKVKLSYGNEITGNQDTNNLEYLARNQVTAVNMDTYTGQDGSYSFRPKWYDNVSSMELFGFTPHATPYGYYGVLNDDSSKGNIGVLYRNVGKYMGRSIDLRMTITDYTFFDLNGEEEIGYFYVTKNRIGLNVCNTRDITATAEFLDHETQQKITVKGYATFSDIDIGQDLSILSPVDQVYVDENCVLYKDPSSLSFTAPFVLPRVGNLINDEDNENWVQVNFQSDHLTYRFGCAYDQYRFIDGNRRINGESKFVWKRGYTGNDHDYSIINPKNQNVWQSWQGLYYQRLGRVSIPPLIKRVSDTDEFLVTENTLSDEKEIFTYTLSHNVPGESERYYYDSYTVTDTFEDELLPDLSSFSVTNDGEADVTAYFHASLQNQTLTVTADPAVLKTDEFYDNNYHFHLSVTVRPEAALSTYVHSIFTVPNEASVFFTRGGAEERVSSNVVFTHYQVPVLPVGEIKITKRIRKEDVVWAHGNPTFLFMVSGIDQRGTPHSYQEAVVFNKERIQENSDGSLTMSTTIPRIPIGTYEIFEMNVLGYHLTGVLSDSSNLSVHTDASVLPDPSCNPLSYGEAVLTPESLNCHIIFTDEKTRYDDYRHTDLISNQIPLDFS